MVKPHKQRAHFALCLSNRIRANEPKKSAPEATGCVCVCVCLEPSKKPYYLCELASQQNTNCPQMFPLLHNSPIALQSIAGLFLVA